MPPSKPACEILAEAYEVTQAVLGKEKSLKQTVNRIIKAISKLVYGIIDIADVATAEVITAVSSVASRVATTYMGSVSKMASSVFEIIFASLLKILLSFPTAIFSIVSIPHDAAKKATLREGILLGKARKKVNSILYIVLKWTSGRSGTDYYNQMIQALPLITSAIDSCSLLIEKLEGNGATDALNSVFDKSAYNKVRANIAEAIKITEPNSAINERLGLDEILENDKRKKLSSKLTKINKTYAKNKNAESAKYRSEIAKVSSSGDGATKQDEQRVSSVKRLANAAKEQVIKLKYEERLDYWDFWRKQKTAIAEAEAENESITNPDNYINAFKTTASEFSSDMIRLSNLLVNLLDDIKDAYKENKKSQLHCNTLYDSRAIVTAIVKEMISFLRSGSDEVADAIIGVIETAQSSLEVVEESFKSDTFRFTDPDRGISAVEMSLDVVGGNGLLKTADALLEAGITESLINTINADDILKDANGEFDQFIQKLSDIPDWDGEKGVWAVNIANSSVSPYIGLIANMTEALAKIPVLSFTNNEADKLRVAKLIKNVERRFKVLSSHNGLVAGTLSSYVPYSSSEAGELKNLLDKAGLLEDFATNMSVTVLAADLVASFSGQFGSQLPSYDKCKSAYPDLFENPALASAAVENNANLEDPRINMESQEARENTENTRYHNKLVSTTDFRSPDVKGAPGQDPEGYTDDGGLGLT